MSVVRERPERREGCQQARHLVRTGEELAGDHGGEEAVDAEIVVFQHVADAGRGDGAAR